MTSLQENTLKDKRYTFSLEWCGYSKQMHVVRFCGYWVGARHTKQGAIDLAVKHNGKRIGVL
jgi:hypothetical protein